MEQLPQELLVKILRDADNDNATNMLSTSFYDASKDKKIAKRMLQNVIEDFKQRIIRESNLGIDLYNNIMMEDLDEYLFNSEESEYDEAQRRLISVQRRSQQMRMKNVRIAKLGTPAEIANFAIQLREIEEEEELAKVELAREKLRNPNITQEVWKGDFSEWKVRISSWFTNLLTRGYYKECLAGLSLIKDKNILHVCVTDMFRMACLIGKKSFVYECITSKEIEVFGPYSIDISNVDISGCWKAFEIFCSRNEDSLGEILHHIVAKLVLLEDDEFKRQRVVMILSSNLISNVEKANIVKFLPLLFSDIDTMIFITDEVAAIILTEMLEIPNFTLSLCLGIVPLKIILQYCAKSKQNRKRIMSTIDGDIVNKILKKSHHLLYDEGLYELLSLIVKTGKCNRELLSIVDDDQDFVSMLRRKPLSQCNVHDVKVNFLLFSSLLLSGTEQTEKITKKILEMCKDVLEMVYLDECKEYYTTFVEQTREIKIPKSYRR